MDKSNEQFFLEIFGEYNGVCSRNFQRMQQKLENAFSANFFPFFLRISLL